MCITIIQNDEVYLSLDANFGLCRKKSARNSVRSPLHSKSLFLDQSEVNEFVNNYGSLQTTNTQVIVPCTYTAAHYSGWSPDK